MQYGAELLTYTRTGENKEEQKFEYTISPLKLLIYFLLALLVSRTILINDMAPFGLAFLLAVISQKEDKLNITVGCGAIIGYVSILKKLDDIALYIILVATIVLFSCLYKNWSYKKKFLFLIGIMYFEMLAYRFFVPHYSLGINITISLLQIVSIVPVYYIMSYAISCLKELGSKHLFTNEEIISMSILFSLMISGTWGINFYGVSLRNLLALIFVMIIAYINGPSTGAAVGVALGIIVGLTCNNMVQFIGVYGICGLMTGIFRETGKWFSGIAFLVSFLLVKIYLGTSIDFNLVEGIIASVVFFSIPEKMYSRISMELDWEKKQYITNESYMEKIKSVFVERLNNFSDVLYYMSKVLNNFMDNENLLMKDKSSVLIENLADRVCSNCDMKSLCWKRELHKTYTGFYELIENYQNNSSNIPYEIERKCVKRNSLIKNTEEIMNNYIINEKWKKRLSEGREILASQISNMASTIGEIVDDFNSDITLNNETERHLRRALEKNDIKTSDILCYYDNRGRLNIKLSLESCKGSQKCVKEILPVINDCVGVVMCIGDEGCSIDPATEQCTVNFEETPKYHVASYVSRKCKDGETYNGDSYSFNKLKDGTYLTIISDGMGSGPQAGEESKASVELIEKFTNAGFDKMTAINTVNSIMNFKFTEDEKFSTLDLNSVDLYTGDITFMKVGAVASFIKRGKEIDIVKSKTLPIGVLDKVDVDITEKKVKSGDLIVTVSDGVLECCDGGKMEWLAEYLLDSKSNNAKELADEIIEKAVDLNGSKAKDDMTVIVSKVYSIY